MGFRSAVKRSTLADARVPGRSGRRLVRKPGYWRIWSDLAAVLIRLARKLYANDLLGVELDNTV